MCFPLKPIFLLVNYFFYTCFPSDRHGFLCKFIVIAFMGMQLWSIAVQKKKQQTTKPKQKRRKPHSFPGTWNYYTSVNANFSQPQIHLLLSLLYLGFWGHTVAPFSVSPCQQCHWSRNTKACELYRVVPASGTPQEPKGEPGGQLQGSYMSHEFSLFSSPHPNGSVRLGSAERFKYTLG